MPASRKPPIPRTHCSRPTATNLTESDHGQSYLPSQQDAERRIGAIDWIELAVVTHAQISQFGACEV